MNKLAFLGLSLLLLCNTGCSKTDEEVDPIVDGASVSGNVGNYNYVDLGLSVKWATYNIGASKPSEYGDYFAWGETKTKDSFLENNYKW